MYPVSKLNSFVNQLSVARQVRNLFSILQIKTLKADKTNFGTVVLARGGQNIIQDERVYY